MNKWLNHTTAAIALLALTLTGCHDRLRGVGAEPDQGAERTSLTVTLSTEVGAFGATRADVTDAQDTVVLGATDTGEDLVKHLTLAMQPRIFLSSGVPQRVGTTNVYTVLFKDILYPGSIKLSCSVYLGQWLPALSLSDFYADKEVTYDQLKTLTSDTDGFVMTSAVGAETMTLIPGITEPSEANGNYLAIDVERVVSKGAVSFVKNNIKDKDYRARYAPTTVGVPEGVISEGASLENAILPIGWAAVGGAKSAYLFRNNAGRRTLGRNSDPDAGLYTGLKTLSAVGKEVGRYDLFKLSDYMSMTGDEGINAAKDKPILFFTEFTGTLDTGTLAKGYNGPGDTSDNSGVSVKGGAYPASPYFLEHALTETSADRTSYPVAVTYADIAYAKVLTQAKAVRGAMIDESDKSGKDLPFYYKVLSSGVDPLAGQTTKDMGDYTEVTLNTTYTGPSGLRVIATDPADAQSSKFYPRRYLVEVSEDWYTANKGKTYPATGTLNLDKPAESTLYPGLKGGDPYRFVKIIFSDAEHWFFEVRDRVLDYYVGVNDGNVYNSLLAARAAGNTKSRKYTLGQAYYLVPFNAQRNDDGKIYNCDTRRNNIYDLRITAIEGMGYNYDPVDPNDPYMPKPEDNPDEPDTVVPSVNTYPQAFRVKARILKWNYIHYSADLKAMSGDAND